jgi:uncharacterized protein YggT (Ycf19 family)
VEFDLDDKIELFRKIESLLDSAIPRPDRPFKAKRLAFGFGDPAPLLSALSLEAIQNADFLLERRAGEPYAMNRYFSLAPMRTRDHVELMEKIEQMLA